MRDRMRWGAVGFALLLAAGCGDDSVELSEGMTEGDASSSSGTGPGVGPGGSGDEDETGDSAGSGTSSGDGTTASVDVTTGDDGDRSSTSDGGESTSGSTGDGASSDGGTTDGSTTDGGSTDGSSTDGGSTDGSSTGGDAECGNGVLESGELCDDGNLDDGDACDAACAVANCFVPITHPTIQAAVDDLACPTVWIAPGTYVESVVVTSSKTVQGLEGEYATIDAGGSNRPLWTTGNDTTFRNLVLTGGSVSGNGGGFRASAFGDLLLENVIISGNTAERGGGASIEGNGTAVLAQVVISDNVATDSGTIAGGGMYISVADVDLQTSTVTSNVATGGNGGGIFVLGGELVLDEGTQVALNEVTGSGGGVSVGFNGSLVLTGDSEIVGNFASSTGGGIDISGDTSATANPGTRIEGNTAGNRGGGIGLDPSATFIGNGVAIVDNVAEGTDGGGIWARVPVSLSLTDTELSGNEAVAGRGGGIFVFTALIGAPDNPAIVFDRSIASGNAADHGGFIAFGDNGGAFYEGRLEATNSTLVGNSATGNGGLMSVVASNASGAQFRNCTIADNSTDGEGSVVYAAPVMGGIGAPAATFANTIVANNVAMLGTSCDATVVGAIATEGYNLVAECDCPSVEIANPGTDACVDPALDPLADNGGPTQTRAITAASPAYNGGAPTGCTFADGSPLELDQRGESRLVDAPCDIGAFELVP